MRLEEMHLYRPGYGSDKGQLRGKVKFASKYGEVELALDEETSAQIVKLCADGIVRAGREIAKVMAADVLDGLALPAPDDG